MRGNSGVQESLATLNKIRAEIDLETGRIERNTSTRDREFELCVRNKQNAWVIVRSRGGHDLYMVLERASSTLLLACEAAEKLNKRWAELPLTVSYCLTPSGIQCLYTGTKCFAFFTDNSKAMSLCHFGL